MKVLFVTEVGDATGIGGHIYSVQALIRALAPTIDCRTVILGGAPCPALEALPWRPLQIPFQGNRLRLRELARFMDHVRQEKPDVIHAFEPTTCAFARVAAGRLGCGLVYTKCGGPNPLHRFPWSYFPRVPRLIVFSRENEDYFKERRDFRHARIWRIPNRVNEVEPDADKVAALRARLDPARPVILRVGRISPSYEKTAASSIRLVQRLAADGIPVQLVFLGAVHDADAEKRIRDALGEHGVVVSDPEWVGQASALLDAGDLIVGTGRGLMEAAARRRVLLAPTRSGQLPALVNERNWQALFDANFSERSEIPAWDEAQNYADIQRVLTDPEYRLRLATFGRELYEKHFALSGAVDLYRSIYAEAAHPGRRRIVDGLQNWAWMVWRTAGRPQAPAASSCARRSGSA